MKKLIFGLAALAAGSVMAIESANIVGYHDRGMVRGEFNYCVANFLPMGKDKTEMTLADFDFVGLKVSEVQSLEDGGNTMVLDWAEYPLLEEDGSDLLAAFTYVSAASAGEQGAGWYLTQDGDCSYNMNDWIVPFGWQIVIDCGDRNMLARGKGTVSPEDEEFELERGVFNYLGNCTPVDIALGDIVRGANFKVSELQFLEDGGNTMVLSWEDFPFIEEDGGDLLAAFTYVSAASAGDNGAGWYLTQDVDCAYNMNEWAIVSGDGFVVDCGDRNASLIIPSAIK